MAASDLTISIPVALPSAERLEEIFREECAKVVGARAKWLRFDEAAKYLGVSLRTFRRKKTSVWGLPEFPLDNEDGVKVVAVADLDALVLAHLVRARGENVIEFPSVVTAESLAKGAA